MTNEDLAKLCEEAAEDLHNAWMKCEGPYKGSNLQVEKWDSRAAAFRAMGPCKLVPVVDVETLARRFHDTYERLAPQFGYETRKETRQFDPTTPNGRLMIAVCGELVAAPMMELP